MEEKNKKRQIVKITVFVTSIFVIFMSFTYAFITQTLTGEKEVVINAGVLDLVLEEENAITISDALPMYDQVGMIQEKSFDFSLVNNTSNDTDYVLKLVKIDSGNELSTSDVKYYLTKEGVGTPALLSSLPIDGTVDSGTISGNDIIDYSLRLWIDSSVTSNDVIAGKTLSYRIVVDGAQSKENQEIVLLEWNSSIPFLETTVINDAGSSMYFYKISNKVFEEADLMGAIATATMGGQETGMVISSDLLSAFAVSKNDDHAYAFGYNLANLLLFMYDDYSDGNVSFSAGVWISQLFVDSGITEAKITITEEQALEREKILFEWYPEKIAQAFWEDRDGNILYKYSTKSLPRANELMGYKVIVEKSDGTREEYILNEESTGDSENTTYIGFLMMFSVFAEKGSFLSGIEVPTGTYMMNTQTAVTDGYVKIQLVKP